MSPDVWYHDYSYLVANTIKWWNMADLHQVAVSHSTIIFMQFKDI